MIPETKWRPTWKDEQTTCSRKPSVAPKGQKVRYIDQFRLKQADQKQLSSESQMKIKSDTEGWFRQVVSIPRRASNERRYCTTLEAFNVYTKFSICTRVCILT